MIFRKFRFTIKISLPIKKNTFPHANIKKNHVYFTPPEKNNSYLCTLLLKAYFCTNFTEIAIGKYHRKILQNTAEN